jgi:hypothetical protein
LGPPVSTNRPLAYRFTGVRDTVYVAVNVGAGRIAKAKAILAHLALTNVAQLAETRILVGLVSLTLDRSDPRRALLIDALRAQGHQPFIRVDRHWTRTEIAQAPLVRNRYRHWWPPCRGWDGSWSIEQLATASSWRRIALRWVRRIRDPSCFAEGRSENAVVGVPMAAHLITASGDGGSQPRDGERPSEMRQIWPFRLRSRPCPLPIHDATDRHGRHELHA